MSVTVAGFVKNGVVVLDTPLVLKEGQAVRVEPLAQSSLDTERYERVRQLQQLFAEWTEEDGKLTVEDGDRLRIALENSDRLSLRTPTLD